MEIYLSTTVAIVRTRVVATVDKTAPGREWLMEQLFLNSVKKIDKGVKKSNRILVLDPIARFADPVADKRFTRAVHVAQGK